MVGSENYFDTAHDGAVNVTTRPRQPGSSIKVVTYAAALEHGYTPATLIDDSPVIFPNRWGPPYIPKNYDGKFHGQVTVRQAFANSYNVPAVKTLNWLGVSTMVAKGRQMGITTWDDSSRFGLSLTLGSGEVYMTDMAEVYSTLPNAGMSVPLNPILSITDARGLPLYQNPCVGSPTPCGGTQTLDPRIAYQLTNILSDNQARSAAFGLHSVLTIPGQEVGVKTGTTNSLRDNWTFGFTNDILVATWVGNNDNTPMSHIASGITGASPMWNKIITAELSGSSHHFTVPTGLEARTYCGDTHGPDCGGCAHQYTEYFLPGTEPHVSCQPPATAGAPMVATSSALRAQAQ
jgi:membrane carboxypeptidase/penicillin-binding protein PbpC